MYPLPIIETKRYHNSLISRALYYCVMKPQRQKFRPFGLRIDGSRAIKSNES